jgi:hypothetical protein
VRCAMPQCMQLPLEVRADALSPEHCSVAPEEKTCSRWVAGGTARLTVRLADRFGNPVHDVDASQLDVACTGPGKVTHSTVYGPRGHSTIIIRLTGRAAGKCAPRRSRLRRRSCMCCKGCRSSHACKQRFAVRRHEV